MLKVELVRDRRLSPLGQSSVICDIYLDYSCPFGVVLIGRLRSVGVSVWEVGSVGRIGSVKVVFPSLMMGTPEESRVWLQESAVCRWLEAHPEDRKYDSRREFDPSTGLYIE